MNTINDLLSRYELRTNISYLGESYEGFFVNNYVYIHAKVGFWRKTNLYGVMPNQLKLHKLNNKQLGNFLRLFLVNIRDECSLDTITRFKYLIKYVETNIFDEFKDSNDSVDEDDLSNESLLDDDPEDESYVEDSWDTDDSYDIVFNEDSSSDDSPSEGLSSEDSSSGEIQSGNDSSSTDEDSSM